MSTARRDMTHGYYQPDMGMRGGQMFRGGGVNVKKKGSIGDMHLKEEKESFELESNLGGDE